MLSLLIFCYFPSSEASGWILKHVDEGAEFLRLHPEEAARSAKYWTARRNLIIANFHSQVLFDSQKQRAIGLEEKQRRKSKKEKQKREVEPEEKEKERNPYPFFH